MQFSTRPVLAVLCSEGDRPPNFERVEELMTVRYTDAKALEQDIAGAEVLLLWDFFSSALRDVWDEADRLAWVHIPAAGVDRLMFEQIVDSSVTITNARGTFDRPLAEFVLMSILAHAKDAHTSQQLQNEQVWRHRETTLVAGRTALVVGTGAIVRETARLLRAVGLEVRGAGRSAREGDPDFGTVVSSASLGDHVGWADFVVLLTPLTDQTNGLVDATALASMKPTAYLVNLGRGACVVEDDLVHALTHGQIAGAALDVFETEPLPPAHPLWTAPGVTVSPHLSGDVHGWRETLARQFVDNVERFVDGRPLLNVVDKRLGFVSVESMETL